MSRTPPTRIVITGFMGAGKTTVAREAGRVLGCDVIDLDEFITAHEGRSPRALIDEEGEAAFREIESSALRAALECGAARVLALGGGAWTIERNRETVAEHGCFSVWLDAPFELCWERVGLQDERPLARERESARTLYEARRDLYALADARVEVRAEDSMGDVARKVLAAAGARDYREKIC